jgi:hypothetical protein
MVPLTARRVRPALVPALALLAVALWLGSARAQFRPPGMGGSGGARPPGMGGGPMGGPLFEHVWKCGKCGQVVARGNSPPPSSCPFCGVKFINGFGPADPNIGGGGGNPNTMPPANGNSGAMPPMQPNNPANPPMNPPAQQPDAAPPARGGSQALPPAQPPLAPLQDPPLFDPGAAPPVVPPAMSSSSSTGRIPLAIKIGLGLGAVLAALILVAVGVLIVYNLMAANQDDPATSRGRKRRRRVAERY